VGERHFLWRGAYGGVWVEGPHMYKKDHRYYLMVAEGGTSYNHAVMIAVSNSITGPYISNERNPILSSRHLSYDNWVHSTGHGDLVELEDGRWFMVALGVRGDIDRGSNMGRETNLIPVQWEREPFWWKEIKYEWPVVAPKTGKVERVNEVPISGSLQRRKLSFIDTFDKNNLDLAWNFRRLPLPNTYSINPKKGHLRLNTKATVIRERGRASLMGFRQTESDFIYEVKMQFDPKAEGSEAGISLFQKDDNYFTFTVKKERETYSLVLRLAEPNTKIATIKDVELPDYAQGIGFKVVSKDKTYTFYYTLDHSTFRPFATTNADHILSRKYTGAYLGLYASSNGKKSEDYADFDWVSYKAFERK
jgi:alpha-N-arabinofuranosidase